MYIDDEIKNILKKANELTIDIASHKTKVNSNKYYGIENEAEEASELTFGIYFYIYKLYKKN